MTITQTVDIPANHRLVIDVPREVPAGPAVLVFKPPEVPDEGQPQIRVFGCAKGKYWMADDFDAPLEDFKDYM
jgi:hypothetical protein